MGTVNVTPPPPRLVTSLVTINAPKIKREIVSVGGRGYATGPLHMITVSNPVGPQKERGR